MTNLFPISITRSTKVLRVRKNKSQISRVFHASFGGEVKMLREVTWVLTELLKPHEIENEIYLGRDVCPLYNCDWSDVPTMGDFKKHYPRPA